MLFETANSPNLCIATAYNLCQGRSSKSCLQSVYRQHKRYLININKDFIDPCTAFRRDFLKQLHKWEKNGDRLSVCIDVNKNLLNKKLHKSITNINLIPIIKNRHRHKIAPRTHSQGSIVIDRTYISPGFKIIAAGCTSFSDAPGDHIALWLDIKNKSLFKPKNQEYLSPSLSPRQRQPLCY